MPMSYVRPQLIWSSFPLSSYAPSRLWGGEIRARHFIHSEAASFPSASSYRPHFNPETGHIDRGVFMINTRSRYTCTPTQVPRPHPAHLSARGEAAEPIGASVRTLEKYCCTSGGPPVLRFLGAIWVVRLGRDSL